MYKLALVQNQDQMAISSKVDIRNFIKDLGYKSVLYTGANIDKLKYDIKQGKIDGIIFSSNCLSEITILREVYSGEFKESLNEFLELGKGCLVLQQNKIIDIEVDGKAGFYNFLPHPFNLLKVEKRPKNEDPRSGSLQANNLSKFHPIMKYPKTITLKAEQHTVVLEEVTKYCVDKDLLYLQYIDSKNVETVLIDDIVFDYSDNNEKRTLVAGSKGNSKHRILIVTMNLDWQKEEELFLNMITYVIEGSVPAAIIKDDNLNNIAFDFLTTILKSEEYRFKEYRLEEFNKLVNEDSNWITNHNIYILGPSSLENNGIYEDILKYFDDNVDSTNIKLISLDNSNGKYNRILISGQERLMLNVLYDIEIKLQREVERCGLVDNSFWNTIETLKIINQLSKRGYLYSTFSKEEYKKIIDNIDKTNHIIENSSYDNMFNPTLALLWIKSNYYGFNSTEAKTTFNWIMQRIDKQDKREQIGAYSNLIELIKNSEGNEHKLEEFKEKLRGLILNEDVESLTEIDLIYYLRASLLIEDLNLICKYIKLLSIKCNEVYSWIDISILASIVMLFLAALEILHSREEFTKDVEEDLEKIIFFTIINIQKSKMKDNKAIYPWQNKALTTLKCIYSILLFEDLLDLPIEDLRKILLNYSDSINRIDLQRNALKILEEYKMEMNELTNKANEAIENEKKTRVELEKIRNDLNQKTIEIEYGKEELKNKISLINDLNQSLEYKECQLLEIDKKQIVIWYTYIIIFWIVIFFIANKEYIMELKKFIDGWFNFITATIAIPTFFIFKNKFKNKEKEKQ